MANTGGVSTPGGISYNISSDEQQALEKMFPTKDPFVLLQMMSDLQPRSVVSFSALDVIRKRFKSSILESFMGSYYIHRIPVERRGRLEISEITSSRRQTRDEED